MRQICQKAGLNIGAVHSHFGSKEALYRAVLVRAGRLLLADQSVPCVEDFEHPEEALRAWMLYYLRLVSLRRDEMPDAGMLLTREFQCPTPAIAELVRDVLSPVLAQLSRTIARMLGERVNSARVKRAGNFVHGICAFQAIGAPMLELFGQPRPTTEAGVSKRLSTLFPMVLAGVRSA